MNRNKPAPQVERARHWIDGKWVGSSTVAKSINPSTGEVLGEYSEGGRVEAAAAIMAARKASYLEFLEDSYGTAGSFKTGGATRFHSDPSGKEVAV